MVENNFQNSGLYRTNELGGEWNELFQTYENLSHIIPGVFFVINNRYRYIKWNKSLENEFGYSRKEISNIPIYKLPEEGNQYNLKLKIDQVFEEGYGQFDYVFLTKAGEKVEYHVQAKRFKYNGEYCIIGSKVNISPLKRAEIMLIDAHRSIKKLRQQLDNVWEDESKPIKGKINFSDNDSVSSNRDLLVNYFNEAEPFLHPDLKLEQVAKKLNLEPRQVSRLLQQEFKLGFNKYINQFRVRKFKEFIELGLTNRFSIEGLMKKVGFNSKATFYKAFKEHEGILPLEYIKSRKP